MLHQLAARLVGVTDAVVVGSGPNGLAAAIRLAEAGRAVVVLEAADAPGGAVRTEELTLPGFRHDTFSSVYPAGAASPVFARMPLRRARPASGSTRPRARRTRCRTARAAVLYRDLGATAASLDALHAGDGERWAAFARPFLDAFEAVRATMLSGFPPLGGPLALLAAPGRCARWGSPGCCPSRPSRSARRLFEGDDARAWLYGAAMHGDTALDARRQRDRRLLPEPARPRGGLAQPARRRAARSPTRSSATCAASAARSAPARASSGSPAGGRVTGVDVAGGEHVDAPDRDRRRDARRARADGRRRPGRLVSPGAERYVYGPATLKVDWALDGPIPWANAEVRGAGTVHVGGGEAELRRSATARDGLPGRARSCCSASRASPTRRARRRASTPRGPTRTARAGRRLGARDRPPRRAHRGAGRALRARLPRPHPRPPRARARPTCEARNANLVGGDVGGGSYRLRQVVFRPLPVALALPHPAARACSSAAPRPSPAARCTACPATRRRRAALAHGAQTERRVGVGDQHERVGRDPRCQRPTPTTKSNSAARVAAGEEDREPGDDHRQDHADRRKTSTM